MDSRSGSYVPPSPELEPVRARLVTALEAEGSPSIAVAVAREGRILWAEGLGWADRARRVRAGPDTPYSLASITKPMTAVALMKLAESGRVDLDAAIENYLPGRLNLRAAGVKTQDVTVRRVAEHTAGLPLHFHFFYEDEPHRRPPFEETMRRYATVVAPPRERTQYSNLGYGMLDQLLARVSGETYAEHLRREVFEPLGMHRTSVDPRPDLTSETATRYGADGVAYPYYDFDHPGGSAVYSSAHDLLRFALAHLGTPLDDQRPLLSAAALAEMQRPSDVSPRWFRYGLGWMTAEDEAGYRTVGHGGGMGGVTTTMALVPSEQIALVALCNFRGDLHRRARVDILSALLPRYAEHRDQALAAVTEQVEPATPVLPESLAADLAGRWEGEVETHESRLPVEVEFAPDGTARGRLDSADAVALEGLQALGARIGARMPGDLRTEDARKRPGPVAFDVNLRGDVLDGALSAMSDSPEGEGGAPHRRTGNALSHYVRLERR